MDRLLAPSVWEVLRQRYDGASPAGSHQDPYRVALAIEGGGNRAAYSAGMSLALDELGLVRCFDAIYGTSGGALNAAWLLTGEAQRWLPSWGWQEVVDRRVTDPRRLLRGGPLVDTRKLVHDIYEDLTPMNFEAILANPVSFHPIATDARTGLSVDLSPVLVDKSSVQSALRASICLPLLAGRPVQLGAGAYVDGGLAEPVPFHSALDQGATHVLVLRTRRSNQRADAATAVERWVLAPYFTLFARGARRAHADRHLPYAADDQRLDAGSEPALAQLRPPDDAPDVSRLSSDVAAISRAIELGRVALQRRWSEEHSAPSGTGIR